MADDKLDEIKDRLSRITEPPWRWEVNLEYSQVELVGRRGSGVTVMDFARWGMSGATPTFRSENGSYKKVKELAVPVLGREHHERWFRTVAHPDAEFIESAPGDVAHLVERVETLQARVEELESRLAYEKNKKYHEEEEASFY